MHITYLVHGFPPFENAGTEQHTALLAKEVSASGHQCTVIAATRQPGRPHGLILHDTWQGIPVHRIVNNIPAIPLASKERRLEIEAILKTLIPKSTDVLHIQHTQFLSSTIPFDGPMVWTLHDAWGWCPSGGTLRYKGTSLCQKPTATDCVHCYANWKPQISKFGHLLMRVAEKTSPFIDTTTLHRIWKRVPSKIRSPIARETKPLTADQEHDVIDRNNSFRHLANRCHTIISPSKFYRQLAEQQGYKPVISIPHGLPVKSSWHSHIGGNGLLFVGSMYPHKGPSLVSEAYNAAFPNKGTPILFVGNGPVNVPHPRISGVSNTEIFSLLQRADALIMGSVWHENYPVILLEAKAVGCPIVAPKCGGIPEIVKDGTDGLLYTMGDKNELAQAMINVLKRKWQPSPPTSSTDMTQQYLELYQKISAEQTQ